ncbi:MAG: family 78 glycoside hydrolase catalytic domain [Ignavibacteriales bacterium]|nr:family 78 glycoside hydrolase catalytic domain [Ignavibacteriales bacterium]
MGKRFSSIKPVELKCEYKIDPAGIDEKQPRFSWITEYDGYDSSQTFYRIIVASTTNNLSIEPVDIWDSCKVQSSYSSQIAFAGKHLHSAKTYYWQVMVWNEKDEPTLWSEPAKFSTGLFEKNDWGAKWISHIYNEKPERTISFQVNKDKWIWYPFSNSDDKFKTIYLHKSFQLERIDIIESAYLIVTADEKFQLFLNKKFVAQSDDKIFSWARPKLCDVKDFLKEGKNIFQVTGLNSYIDKPGFTLRLEIKFTTGETFFILTDKSWLSSLEQSETNLVNAEEVAIVGEKPWRVPKAELEFNPAAYFRKTFRTTKNVTRGFVYCTALGLYHLRINSKQVGEDRLTPGWSDFNKRVYYNSYDVTSNLGLSDEHVINIILADGYYSGYCGWEKGKGYYGKFPAFKLQLMISYDDGSDEIISTDETWTSSEGPIREADILMGEFYDTNFEPMIEGWDTYPSKNVNFKKVKVIPDINPELAPYKAEEVKIRCELKPQSIKEINKQKFIIDFGQNFTGFVKLVLKNVSNQKIVLRFAEMLNNDGSLYTENIRMARAQDTYISKGDNEETWQPLFTYHGFRYVEVTGLDKIEQNTITGISINSLPEQTSTFTSSDEKLNKLFNCILWNQRSNYVDIPTDCPQRDERLGWTGDAVSFFKTAAFNFYVSSFYSKWLTDLFDAQREDGALPPFAPFVDMGVGPVYFNSAGWADAGIVTPYLFFKYYNDVNLLEKYYERMKSFTLSLKKMSNNFVLPEYGYGDWLYIGEETAKSFIATAYFAYDCSLMSRIAAIIGSSEDEVYYADLFNKIKQSFRKAFLNDDGSLSQLTQTAVVLAIHFELLESEEKIKAINYLTKNIIDNGYHIKTGFLGLSFLMPVLSSINRNDIAWKVLTNNEFPSWFFMIDNGATTLWERWDSYHPERGFYDPTMNSFNHCSLGCVGEWLFTDLAGIIILEPGFKKVMIKPFIPEELIFAKASFKTIHGVIKSAWKKNVKKLLMKVTIPFNTKAIIVLPSIEFELKEHHKVIKKENGCVYLEVGSGSYEISCKLE